MKKVSSLFKDRERKPLDSALWWVEYVLRHENTLHLKPRGSSQTWYQRRLLDVWLFFAFLGVLLSFVAGFLIKKTVNHLLRMEIVGMNGKVVKIE